MTKDDFCGIQLLTTAKKKKTEMNEVTLYSFRPLLYAWALACHLTLLTICAHNEEVCSVDNSGFTTTNLHKGEFPRPDQAQITAKRLISIFLPPQLIESFSVIVFHVTCFAHYIS